MVFSALTSATLLLLLPLDSVDWSTNRFSKSVTFKRIYVSSHSTKLLQYSTEPLTRKSFSLQSPHVSQAQDHGHWSIRVNGYEIPHMLWIWVSRMDYLPNVAWCYFLFWLRIYRDWTAVGTVGKFSLFRWKNFNRMDFVLSVLFRLNFRIIGGNFATDAESWLFWC